MALIAVTPSWALGQSVAAPLTVRRPQDFLKVRDCLREAAPGAVRLEGWIGESVDNSIRNRVMPQDIDRIVTPFQERTEENAGHWRCEYWGKWFTSAVLAAAYTQEPQDLETVRTGAKAVLATASPDGYIGTYRDGKRLEAWDVWGRKYVLLGLLADHALSGNEESLKAAQRLADLLMQEAPAGQVKLVDLGLEVVGGLPPSSILEPFALLYQRTGDHRYLEYCQNIVADWSRPGKFSAQGPRLLEHVASGVAPARIGSRKAYEMMSCFEGLCELYRITGEEEYLQAVLAFARSIEATEIMVHGSGSNQELWSGGKRLQTGILEQPVETCVTVTWMKLCEQLLRLTGDPVWADAMEVTLYNALAGAMTPDGAWWAYFSPLLGQRVPSHYQHADMQLSCCVANGPRGLLLTPRWAVMGHEEGPVVNLYEQGDYRQSLNDGTVVTIHQETGYPQVGVVKLKISLDEPKRFVLRLRIPTWSAENHLVIEGEECPAQPGEYAQIDRLWSAGDEVKLTLDMRGRAIPAPSGAPEFAVMRGPVVLALDDRLVKPADLAVWLELDEDGELDMQPVDSPDGVRMTFGVPFQVRPTHYFHHHSLILPMCDYASAGNAWSGENLFRVWLPQPLFLRDAYPTATWRLTCPDIKGDTCPVIPSDTSVKAGSLPLDVVDSASLQVVGMWQVAVRAKHAGRSVEATIRVPPPEPVRVADERMHKLELWEDKPGWARPKIPGLVDGACSARFLLDADSLVVRAGSDKDSTIYQRGVDYEADEEWGTIGRISAGRIGPNQPVYLEYQFAKRRLDSVVITPSGDMKLRTGDPHVSMPVPPNISRGEKRVANIWLPENITQLERIHLFPIEETSYPSQLVQEAPVAENLLPETLSKLRSGASLRILAWGDSVTEGYLGEDQWQKQFAKRLQDLFPQAEIELVTVGWGAHNSDDFLRAPAGHSRNFAETVLSQKPDLVVSEFINDTPLDTELVSENYLYVLKEFQKIGAEWIIVTPHYSIFTNPPQERDIDEDPREYVKMVRGFGRQHGVAVADAAARYGRLWRQGIPYTTLMVNAANHPDKRGMKIFADSLMALFSAEGSEPIN